MLSDDRAGTFLKNKHLTALDLGTIWGIVLPAKRLVIRSATEQTNYHHTNHGYLCSKTDH
jgi:hypothetical protein